MEGHKSSNESHESKRTPRSQIRIADIRAMPVLQDDDTAPQYEVGVAEAAGHNLPPLPADGQTPQRHHYEAPMAIPLERMEVIDESDEAAMMKRDGADGDADAAAAAGMAAGEGMGAASVVQQQTGQPPRGGCAKHHLLEGFKGNTAGCASSLLVRRPISHTICNSQFDVCCTLFVRQGFVVSLSYVSFCCITTGLGVGVSTSTMSPTLVSGLSLRSSPV